MNESPNSILSSSTSSTNLLPVYLRLKPSLSPSHNQDSFLDVDPNLSQVTLSSKDVKSKPQETFSFNGVFTENSTQVDVYNKAVLPLVQDVFNSKSDGLLFSMGSSGSGKTHTILGYKQTPGMIHFAIDTLFKSINGNIAQFETVEELSYNKYSHTTSQAIEASIILDWGSSRTSNHISPSNHHLSSITPDPINPTDNYTYAIYISMVEIYNDRICDLFSDSASKSGTKPALLIKTDRETNKIYLDKLRKIYVSDIEEAFKTIELGLSLRTCHSTGMNSSSSRSHAFAIMEIKRISKHSLSISSTTLTIADLAGSERVTDSKTEGERFTESRNINRSLMSLGQCLQKQRDGLEISSTLRNSKLTQLLLTNAFNPKLNQKSVLITNIDRYGNVNPASQILRYSAVAKKVTIPQPKLIESRVVSGNSTGSSSTYFEQSEFEDDWNDASQNALLERISQLEDELRIARQESDTIEVKVREELCDVMDIEFDTLQQQYNKSIDQQYKDAVELANSKIALTQSLSIRNHGAYRELENSHKTLIKMFNMVLEENKNLHNQLGNYNYQDRYESFKTYLQEDKVYRSQLAKWSPQDC